MVVVLSSALLVGTSACSSSDTILALTIQSGMDLRTPDVAINELRVTVTPGSGSPFTTTLTPRTTVVLVDGGVDAGGSEYTAIQASYFERITLPGDLSGDATVRVDALESGASTAFAAGETATDIRKGGATAASVMLTIGGPPPPDGGAGGSGGGAGTGGGTGGVGGNAGGDGAGGEGGDGGGAGGRGGRGGRGGSSGSAGRGGTSGN
jgi:hypothetical protein